jgi:ribose transport system substrate-binding protein
MVRARGMTARTTTNEEEGTKMFDHSPRKSPGGASRHALHRGRALTLALVLAAAVAAGCGSSSSESDSGSAATAAPSTDTATPDAQLEKYFKGTYTGPPTTAPKAEAGKNVWLVSAGQAATVASMAIAGANDAGKALGWKTTVFDGKFDPSVWANGIRQAMADKADGILLYLIDCNLVKGPLQQARKAGITVVAVESLDCNETNPGQEPLFSAMPEYVEGTYGKWIKEFGRAQAQWAIAKTGGKAEVLYPKTDEVMGYTLIREGAEEQLKKCAACKIDYYEFRQADLGPQLRQKTEQALLKNPKANVMILPLDSMVTAGVGAAITGSGRSKMLVVGAEGEAANIDMIRDGKPGMNAGVGIPTRYEGFAGIDAMLRLFAGEKPAPSGIGIQVFDKEHNLPASGTYAAPIDFEAEYKKAWGVTG